MSFFQSSVPSPLPANAPSDGRISDLSFAAEFTEKTFICNEEKLGFVYENRRIIRIVNGLWAERAGLRIDDEIIKIQNPQDTKRFLDFAALKPPAKLLALKQKRPVAFIVTRKVKDTDLHDAAVKMQAVFKGKKLRSSLSLSREDSPPKKINCQDVSCFRKPTIWEYLCGCGAGATRSNEMSVTPKTSAGGGTGSVTSGSMPPLSKGGLNLK